MPLTHNEVSMIVTEALLNAGWTQSNGAALVTKEFKTAAGVRQAAVYLSKGDEYNRTISGDYWSEGRNALEGSSILVPVGADAAKVSLLAEKFCLGAEKMISQTYAMKLMAA
jgi:hypothetical protein